MQFVLVRLWAGLAGRFLRSMPYLPIVTCLRGCTMPYNLDLSFRERESGAVARVAVIHMTGGLTKDGLGAISPHCVSVAELVSQVERLKKELDDVLAKGKRKFRQHARARR